MGLAALGAPADGESFAKSRKCGKYASCQSTSALTHVLLSAGILKPLC